MVELKITVNNDEELNNVEQTQHGFDSAQGNMDKNQVNLKSTILTQTLPKLDDASAKQDEQIYEIEQIVDRKIMRKKVYYQVRWKGYTAADDTWEPKDSLFCYDLIDQFEKDRTKNKRNVAADKQGTKRKSSTPVEPAQTLKKVKTGKGSEAQNLSDDKKSQKKLNTKQKATKLTLSKTKSKEKPVKKAPAKQTKSVTSGLSKKSAKTLTPVASKKKTPTTKVESAVYEIEKIVGRKVMKNKVFYRIRWKGYTAKDDTWEPLNSFINPELIKVYEESLSQKDQKGKQSTSPNLPKKLNSGVSANGNDDQLKTPNEIERIIGARETKNGKREYLVQYKAAWKSENDLLNCEKLIKDYEKRAKKNSKASKSGVEKHQNQSI